MKKMFASFLAFSLLSAFVTGCHSSLFSSRNTNSLPEETANSSHEEYRIKMLTDQWGCGDYFGTASGFYALENMDSNTYHILYTDYKTHTTVYLCPSPSCTHLDESCVARLSVPNCGAAILADDAHLFIITFGSAVSDVTEFQRIYIANLDGSNRHLLCELKPEETFGRNFASDGHFLYFDIGLTGLNEKGLYDSAAIKRINLTTEEAETVIELSDGGQLAGAAGDQLLIQTIQIPEIKTEADYQKIKNSLYAVSLPDQEKTQLFTWDNGSCNVCVSGDSIYSLDLASGTLYLQKVSDISTKIPLANLPFQPIGYSIFQYIDRSIVVLDAGKSNDIDTRYIVALDDHSLHESSLKYNDGGISRYYKVLASAPDGYFVTFNVQEFPRTETLATGDIETFMVRQDVRGLITKEDYINSQSAIQAIEPLA